MPIQVKILADSISPQGRRLTTFQYQAHRWILAEINTHKMISKNARSSRAVPVKKIIEEVRNDPAMPVFWGKNKSGMVAVEEMDPVEIQFLEKTWRQAAKDACNWAEYYEGFGLHKQTVNRLLEPFMWAHGILTATDWGNFFALRTAPDAQPEFKALADQMLAAYEASQPKLLNPGEWHLPYVTEAEYQTHSLETLKMLSAARVARVSYKPFDGDDSIEKELSRAQALIDGGHWSPFEHQGTPDYVDGVTIWNGKNVPAWEQTHLHGNFHGWIQLRKTFGGENRQHPSCDR